MSYFAVLMGSKLRVSSDKANWKLACLECFGLISNTMRIKNIGSVPLTEEQLAPYMDDPENWFQPYVEHGATMEAFMAWGPDEIAKLLKEIIEATLPGCRTKTEVQEAYLRGEKFKASTPSKLFDTFREICIQHGRSLPPR